MATSPFLAKVCCPHVFRIYEVVASTAFCLSTFVGKGAAGIEGICGLITVPGRTRAYRFSREEKRHMQHFCDIFSPVNSPLTENWWAILAHVAPPNAERPQGKVLALDKIPRGGRSLRNTVRFVSEASR